MSEQILVTFWGTRGSIAAPGRSTEKYGGNTSCVSVEFSDSMFIFDAGTGIRSLGVNIMNNRIPKEGEDKYEIHMFLSHTHWDHIQGLPFFQPAYHPGFKLNIYGSATQDAMLERLLIGQMDSNYFPVPMSSLGSDMNITEVTKEPMTIGNARITFEDLDHPGGAVAFRLEKHGKSIVYATDNELNNQFTEEGILIDNNPLGIAYSKLIAGTDLLIADGQYTSEEYKIKKGWGHTSIPALLNVAHKAGVKQTAVYHHDPMHTDNMLDELSSSFLHKFQDLDPRMDIFWAREGLTLAV